MLRNINFDTIFISDYTPLVKANISTAPIKCPLDVIKSTFSLRELFSRFPAPHLEEIENCPSLILTVSVFYFPSFALIIFEASHPLRPVFRPYIARCSPGTGKIECSAPSESPQLLKIDFGGGEIQEKTVD